MQTNGALTENEFNCHSRDILREASDSMIRCGSQQQQQQQQQVDFETIRERLEQISQLETQM